MATNIQEEMMNDPTIWDVARPQGSLPRDTIDWEYMKYENSGADVSSSTNYRLWTTDQNSFYYLPSAYLQVDFKVTSDGTTQVVLADQTALASNGWSLFQDIRLRMQDVEVAHVLKPGKLSQMRNLLEAGKDYIETVGENSHYFIDHVSDVASTSTVAYTAPLVDLDGAAGTSPAGLYHEIQYVREQVGADANHIGVTSVSKNPKFDPSFQRKIDRAIVSGNQKIFLPLRDIFPLMQMDKVVRGTKIEVEANKISNKAEALFGATTAAQVHIQRMQLWIARVRPSLDALARLEQQMNEKPVIEHTFDNVRLYSLPYSTLTQGEQVWQLQHKQNRPTKVLIGFQFATRDTDVRLNPLQFDLLGAAGANVLNRVELRHNGKQVPNIVFDPSYDYSRILQELYRMGYKEGDVADSSIVNYKNWKTLYPIFGFDLEKLEGAPYESRSQSTLDLVWSTNADADANYNIVAVVYSEGKAYIDHSSGVTTFKTI